MVDHVALYARLQPDHLAIHDLAAARRYSYAALDAAVASCAGFLERTVGVKAGDRVASLARNHAWLAILHLACARMGAIYVPLNWRLAPPELAALLEDADPSLLVGDPDLLAGVPGDPERLDIAGLQAAAEATPCWQGGPIDRNQPSLILYTSGTSGRPKGVLLTEANLDQTAINFTMLGGVGARSVFLGESPMFHIIGLVTTLRPPLMMGATVLLSDRFDPPRTLAWMADASLGVTHYFCVPQMAARLRADPAFDAARLAGRVTVFTGGAPHRRDDIMPWLDSGIPLVDGFGMSEAGTVFGMPTECGAIAGRAGSVGVAPPGVQARIVNADGTLCEDGAAGELQLRGANITSGYWRRPSETAAAFTEDGWFRSGDILVRDTDGFHKVVDRKKDMFISGGENVYPAEVEAALAGFPGIAESAVVGVADAHWGEVGHCALVAMPGVALNTDAVLIHLGRVLARYKLPKHISVLPALPKTGSGKIRKVELRAMFNTET